MSATQVHSTFFAPITNTAGAGTFTLVAAVAGKSIVVISLCVVLTGTTPTLIFADDTPTNLTGALSGGSPISISGSRLDPIFSTGMGKALQMTLVGTSAQCRGFLTYRLEDGQ